MDSNSVKLFIFKKEKAFSCGTKMTRVWCLSSWNVCTFWLGLLYFISEFKCLPHNSAGWPYESVFHKKCPLGRTRSSRLGYIYWLANGRNNGHRTAGKLMNAQSMQRALLSEYISNDVSALASQIWNSPKETSQIRDSTGFAMPLHLHKLDLNSYLLKR